MNLSLVGLSANIITENSPLVKGTPFIKSFLLGRSSIRHSISPAIHHSGRILAAIIENTFSFFLGTPVIMDEALNFTMITTKQTPSSNCVFSFDEFYGITSSAMGGGMLISSSSLSVSLHSCKFVQCYTTYSDFSAGGLSVYQAYNFSMECCLFDNCSTTVSDTNSFQINSLSNTTQYCTMHRISDINGGLMFTNGMESAAGGSSGLSYSSHNVTSSHSSGSAGFMCIILSPSNSAAGRFSQCMNCQAKYDINLYNVNTAVTLEYMNIINTTGSSYILYTADNEVGVTICNCVFVYPQSISLTSFTATSSKWASFVNCSFSFTPTAAQISGNSISGMVNYNASAGDANYISKSADLTCFLWPNTNLFTTSGKGGIFMIEIIFGTAIFELSMN